MPEYSFVTHWSFPAPVERVWREITHPLDWPAWWPGVERVEKLRPGTDADGLGSIHRSTWKSILPYRLTFQSESVRIERFKLFEIRATGQLEGRGVWHFDESDGTTRVRYDWNVDANKLWMRLLSPVLKPLFRWNHDAIMRWGGDGLAKRLAATV
jgi:uncharacterized protein YndB with AHSA1/START domain